MKVIIGCDFAGFELKQEVQHHLSENKKVELIDIGMTSLDKDIPYYEVGAIAARKLQAGDAERGILFCGTGMGVSIAANKFKGVYASVVESEFTGERCKIINNSNIITMGGWVVSPYRAKKICDLWLGAAFARGDSDLEEFSDFLKDAFREIQVIEKENFK
jgi:ribose 5-phosphate isomerase B